MLIALYLFIQNIVFPRTSTFIGTMVEPTMLILITITGIIILLSAVGLRVSRNLGSTVINGIFSAIGYVVRTLVNAIGWIVRSIFLLMLPRVFHSSRATFANAGMNQIVADILATFVSVLTLAIII